MIYGSTLVNAIELDTVWARRNDARTMMPALLRRLVRATTAEIILLSFPSGESTDLPGWDGTVTANAGSEFVPGGVSGWEIGTNQDVTAKANEDYIRRSADPIGLDKRSSVFVFVTPRRWPGKDRWLRIKNADRTWQEVRAYDARDLEVWLEMAPAVHIWLSMRLGKQPEGVRDLDSFWTEWADITTPALSPEIVLAGRDAQAQRIKDWLGSETETLAIKGDTQEEALAAFAASVRQMPASEADAIQSRTVIVDTEAAWNRLSAMETSLTLIANFDIGTRYMRGLKSGHRVVILLGRSDRETGNTLVLPRLKRYVVAEVLEQMGVEQARRGELAKLARRSLLAFRRKLSQQPSVQQPTWSRPGEARSIVPLLLAGMWNANAEGDRDALASLARSDYEAVSASAVRWANEPDPPLRRVGDSFFITSKEDAWFLLAPYVTLDDLSVLQEVVLQVLGEINTKYDLPPEERWLSSVRQKGLRFSGLLRKGLAETLAVMAVHSDQINVTGGLNGQQHSNGIVRQLFDRANADWRLWASLDDVIPVLAEACPDIFLQAVEAGTTGDDPVILRNFLSPVDPLLSSSPHTGILWALERLSWPSTHIGRAALSLAKLARLDPEPDSRHANRPARSLRGIFLLWHPQTSATGPERLEVIDSILQWESEVAWRLLLAIIPTPHSVGDSTSNPEWRDWVTDPTAGMTWRDVWQMGEQVVSRLIGLIGTNVSRWTDLLELVPSLPKNLQDMILNEVELSGLDAFTSADRLVLRDQLRSLLTHHRSFPEAAWVLPDEQLERLDRLYHRLEPMELFERHAWLFSQRPALLETSSMKWDEREQELRRQRLLAINEIYAEGGQDKLHEFAGIVEEPFHVGLALGRSEVDFSDGVFLQNGLASEDRITEPFTRGYVAGRIDTRGRLWFDTLRSSDTWAMLSPTQRAQCFHFLDATRATWDLLNQEAEEVRQTYWTTRGPIFREDCAEAVEYLLRYERPYVAIHALSFWRDTSDETTRTDLIVRALDLALRTVPPGKTDWSSLGHDIGRLLDVLSQSDDRDEALLAKYEWNLLPLLKHYRAPLVLYREMAKDPEFFVQLLQYAFKARKAEKQTPTAEDAALAHSAFELLHDWRTVPGLQADGTIDIDALRSWVMRTRELAAECDRGEIADQYIGQALSSRIEGADQLWPSEPVRQVIQEIGSKDIEQGFLIGVVNSRGVTSRGIGEGGKQERDLASYYRDSAKAFLHRWPRVAAIFERLAESYEHEARREDLEAELDEDL
jgi:hypothetical protein